MVEAMSLSQIAQKRLEALRIDRIPYPDSFPEVFVASHELSEVELRAVLIYELKCSEVTRVNAELDMMEQRQIANDPILRALDAEHSKRVFYNHGA